MPNIPFTTLIPDPSVPEWPNGGTSQFYIGYYFYNWIAMYASRPVQDVTPDRATPLIDVKAGEHVRVRGFPLPNAYDHWVDAKVIMVQPDFKLPGHGNVVTDRILAQFISDPVTQRKGTGYFYKKWGEYCAVGQEHHFPPMDKETFVNMVQSRMVYTPILTISRRKWTPDARWEYLITWIPAFVEEYYEMPDGKYELEVRFTHFFDGFDSTKAPLRVKAYAPFFGLKRLGPEEAMIHHVLNSGEFGSEVHEFHQGALQVLDIYFRENGLVPRIPYKDLPWFTCECVDSEPCRFTT